MLKLNVKRAPDMSFLVYAKTLRIKIYRNSDFSLKIKWSASRQWSFGPDSTGSSIESTTIGKTHPTLSTEIQTVPNRNHMSNYLAQHILVSNLDSHRNFSLPYCTFSFIYFFAEVLKNRLKIKIIICFALQ